MRSLALLVVFLAIVTAQEVDDDDDMSMEGDCDMKFRHKGAMKMAGEEMGKFSRMMKKFAESCVEFKCPKSIEDMGKKCAVESVKTSMLADELKKGMMPDATKLGQFVDAFLKCKMDALGVKSNGNNIDKNVLTELVKLPDWKGEDIQVLRDIAKRCVDSINGSSPVQQYASFEKCVVYATIDKCEETDEDPGVGFMLMSLTLSLNDDSKCSAVKVPAKVKEAATSCLNEAKRNVGPMPAEIENENDPMKKMKMIGKRFMSKIMYNATICYAAKLEIADAANNKSVNFSAFANYVKGFQGWDSIPKERDVVTEAFTQCGNRAFTEFKDDSMEKNSAESRERMGMNGTEIIQHVKLMMKVNMRFQKCFSPRFVKTCGTINNDIGMMLFPMFNSETMTEISAAFMETGGESTLTMLEMLKKNLGMA